VGSNITFTAKVVVPAQTGQTTAAPLDQTAQVSQAKLPETAAVAEVVAVDTFGGVQPPPTAALTGSEVHPLASRMASNLEGVGAMELVEQMHFDLSVQLPALMGSATLGREVKAARLMEFLTPYAERLATLTKTTPLTADQRSELANHLLKPMMTAGLGHVVELTTQKTGQQVAETMLGAERPEAVRGSLEGLRFDSTDPNALVGGSHLKNEHLALAQQPQAIAASNRSPKSEDEENPTDENRNRQKSGSLWGGLHKDRSEMGRLLDDEKWMPDDKAIYAAGLVALVISLTVAALLTLFR